MGGRELGQYGEDVSVTIFISFSVVVVLLSVWVWVGVGGVSVCGNVCVGVCMVWV